MSWSAVFVNAVNVLSVPHSSHAVVACAFGFTDPLSVALSAATADAAVVVTVGGGGGVAESPPPPPHANRVKPANNGRIRNLAALRNRIESSLGVLTSSPQPDYRSG